MKKRKRHMKKFVICGCVGLATVIEARDHASALRKAIRFNMWQGVGYRSLTALYDKDCYPDVYEYVPPGEQARYDRHWRKDMNQMLKDFEY